MVRAPCCEKIGLKKGPWTAEEDRILIAYINKHTHSNWRQLPKKAGLLRCGKSCRLRWINYLRPDIKRGNFTKEEEETIINLHEMLGNRWSAIAARLPGRTDNEIKNVWHTHLKKRVLNKHNQQPSSDNKQNSESIITKPDSDITSSSSSTQFAESGMSSSPQPCCSSDVSLVTTSTGQTNHNQCVDIVKDEQIVESFDKFPEIDESFWTEALSENSTIKASDFRGAINELQTDYDMGFWYNMLVKTGGDSTLQH